MVKKGVDQSDLFGTASAEDGRYIYTVSDITRDIQGILENTFAAVWVEGEISNYRPSASGHYYFSLKDESALLAAVIFKGASRNIKFNFEDGLKVICFGNVEVYPPHGKYQLIVEKIEPKGIGSLQLALEQLKTKLDKEGLFAQEHKRLIPHLPSRVGIVTSLQGAAIKDILKVLDRRFKDLHIIINSVKVQGEGAREEIAQAIEDFNFWNESAAPDERVDVLIVGRGGGSVEDLWAFNEEIVCRAIYNSKIPVISAVGHERDVTLSDLVADLRAATPSVAAEIVIPKKEDLRVRVEELTDDLRRSLFEIAAGYSETVEDLSHRLRVGLDHAVALESGKLAMVAKKLLLLSPLALVQRYEDKISQAARAIIVRMEHVYTLRCAQFAKQIEKLTGLSPLNILARGYSITFLRQTNGIMKDAGLLKPGDVIESRLHKGTVVSTVTEVSCDGRDKV
ncbi:MAG TPA: exodeoxyribonuclease VII large subunit [Candidatus Omnitrophota bacterium]|nr:exodeoxyribonuclease VII large subunit [Candidatus Omnitrophota bacterium]HPT07157.1 exodeoxyribonuclease VII large subunit [Candidatus Omnitrophota bacterium]